MICHMLIKKKKLLSLVLVFLSCCLPNGGTAQSLEDVNALDAEAARLYQQGKYAEAVLVLERILESRERVLGPDAPETGASLNNLALLYDYLGDYGKAASHYQRALTICERELGPEHLFTARTVNNLAGLYVSLDDYAKAKPLLERALAITEKYPGVDHPDTARSLNNLAMLYSWLGDYGKAEPLFHRALHINEKSLGPDHPDTAKSLNNLAMYYSALGQYEKVELFLQRALLITEKALGLEHPFISIVLNNLALLYADLHLYGKAKPLFVRALEIREKTLGLDHQETYSSINNLALLYFRQGDLDKAWKMFEKTGTHQGLGIIHLARGEFRKAEKAFSLARQYVEAGGQKDFIVSGLIGLAAAAEGLMDYGEAREYFTKAIEILESQREALGFGARESFLSGNVGLFSRWDAYEGLIRVILREQRSDFEKESFRAAERVKSRMLLEMITTRGVRGRGEADQGILERDREFQIQLTGTRKQIDTLTKLGEKAPAGNLEAAQAELGRLSAEYESFIKDVKLKNSELASLLTVEVPDIEKIQKQLDPGTTFVEYFTGKDRTYVWLVSREKITVKELPLKEKDLSERVSTVMTLNISNRSRRAEPVMVRVPEGEKEISDAQRKENRRRFIDEMKALYRDLVAPVAGEITTGKLIVVPHGPLHKVPFCALHDGTGYLVDRFSISVLPSISVIPHVIAKRNTDEGTLLALADPKTEKGELKYADDEVMSISEGFGRKNIYLKEQATEERARREASSPDVIHFACHGEFNDRQPLQSGLLLASEGQEDGRLQVHEIFSLDLRGANLVALSACETGLGKITSGDDMVGLSRAFLYAGTPSLMASLWAVDDLSTSRLMKQFYTKWRKEGVPKPEALRQAQKAIKATPGFEHPFYWAAFELIGDWQ